MKREIKVKIKKGFEIPLSEIFFISPSKLLRQIRTKKEDRHFKTKNKIRKIGYHTNVVVKSFH